MQGENSTNRPPASAKTQRSRILGRLISAHGGWVPSPEIAACAQQYNARLHELRRLGFVIENRMETDEQTGERKSWFRLVQPSPAVPVAPWDSGDWYERDGRKRSGGLTDADAGPLFAAAVVRS